MFWLSLKRVHLSEMTCGCPAAEGRIPRGAPVPRAGFGHPPAVVLSGVAEGFFLEKCLLKAVLRHGTVPTCCSGCCCGGFSRPTLLRTDVAPPRAAGRVRARLHACQGEQQLPLLVSLGPEKS